MRICLNRGCGISFEETESRAILRRANVRFAGTLKRTRGARYPPIGGSGRTDEWKKENQWTGEHYYRKSEAKQRVQAEQTAQTETERRGDRLTDLGRGSEERQHAARRRQQRDGEEGTPEKPQPEEPQEKHRQGSGERRACREAWTGQPGGPDHSAEGEREGRGTESQAAAERDAAWREPRSARQQAGGECPWATRVPQDQSEVRRR